ncbi:MAG: hypothetical protein QFF03_09820 [Pseudomonadota bacterium]|nr:hypothetical protein [Pseudomonadota bacterium]
MQVSAIATFTNIWDVKYTEQFWRPVTGIREAVEGIRFGHSDG